MFSSKLALVCGSLISSGSMLLVYTEGVSVLHIFITENTFFCLHFSLFVCLLILIFSWQLDMLGGSYCKNFFRFFKVDSSLIPKKKSCFIPSTFHSLSLNLLNAYDVPGIMLFNYWYPEYLEEKIPLTFTVGLEYHLAEFAPSSSGWCVPTIDGVSRSRKNRDVKLISAASVVPILWRKALVFVWTISYWFSFWRENSRVLTWS